MLLRRIAVARRWLGTLGIIVRSATPGFIVLYRWKLRPHCEESFAQAWSEVTKQLMSSAGWLGSRLHRGSDNLWYGYAQWRDEETRQKAFAAHLDPDLSARMQSSIAETFPEVKLECIANYLVER